MSGSQSSWFLPPISKRGDFDCLFKKDAPIPKPSKGEVLIKVRATSLNYRDLGIVQGHYPLSLQDKDTVPLSDGAGEVVETGEGVKQWAKGDRVCANFSKSFLKGFTPAEGPENDDTHGGGIDGLLTQYQVIPAAALVRIPSHLSFEEAATLPCAALTAYNSLYGLEQLSLKPGETAVLLGTGGVSVFGAQLAIAGGAKAVITSSSDDKLEKVKALFSAEQQKRLFTVNYKKNPEWHEEVRKVAPEGASHVLEVGGPGTLERSFKSIKRGGVISDIGYVAAGEAPNVGYLALVHGAIYRGILVGSVQQFEAMNRVFETHGIKPLVDKVFKYDDAPEAYRYQHSAQHAGKVVIHVQ